MGLRRKPDVFFSPTESKDRLVVTWLVQGVAKGKRKRAEQELHLL